MFEVRQKEKIVTPGLTQGMEKEQEGVDLLMKHKVWSYQYPQDKKRKNNRHAHSPWGAKLSAAERPIANPQRFLQAAVADRLLD